MYRTRVVGRSRLSLRPQGLFHFGTLLATSFSRSSVGLVRELLLNIKARQPSLSRTVPCMYIGLSTGPYVREEVTFTPIVVRKRGRTRKTVFRDRLELAQHAKKTVSALFSPSEPASLRNYSRG